VANILYRIKTVEIKKRLQIARPADANQLCKDSRLKIAQVPGQDPGGGTGGGFRVVSFLRVSFRVVSRFCFFGGISFFGRFRVVSCCKPVLAIVPEASTDRIKRMSSFFIFLSFK
jgi:hypothetical protein